MRRSRSFLTGAALYAGVAVAGAAPLMGWAWLVERRRGRLR
jgi:hypothetical protein